MKVVDKVAKRGRGRPARISKQAILDAVLQHGSDPTLSAIADQLKVTPQAIYHHIQSHSDLIESLYHEIVLKLDGPDPTGREWSEFAVSLGLYMYKVYAAVPGIAEYSLTTPWQSPAVYQRQERMLELAVADGMDLLKAFWAGRAIADFIQGWVVREHLGQLEGSLPKPHTPEALSELPSELRQKMTLTEEALRLSAETKESRFEFSLRALVKGLSDLARE